MSAYSEQIQIRLTLYFLLILIPLVGISLFANVRSTDILEEQTGTRTTNNLLSVLDNVDMTLRDLENLSLLIVTDTGVRPALLEARSVLLTSDIYSFYTVMDRLQNIVAIQGSLREISVLHTSSGMLLSTQYGARRIAYEDEGWYHNAMAAGGKMVLHINDDGHTGIFGSNTVSFMRLMDVPDQKDTPNVLVLTLNRNVVQEMIQSLQQTANTSVYLYSSDGQLVTGTDRAYPVDEWNGLGAGKTGRTDSGMLVWRMQSEQSGWSLVMIQPEVEVYADSRQLSYYTTLIIAISIILALLISFGVYKWISAPLSELLYGMKQLRLGKLNTRLHNRRRDEFGTLKEAFNQMIEQQQSLIHDVYEHQLQVSKTELKFLHSQINPHFLYNTLDSIYWTAKNYDADEISDMVLNLSKFFRLSLSKGRETFTVEETIEHLQYYLKVQQFRFIDQFTVKFDIDERTKSIRVLKLLLQPIVENAILHGLEKRSSDGELLISSTISEGRLHLTVKDNGAGMSPERLRYIRSELEIFEGHNRWPLTPEQIKDLFGLRNVLGRMKLYYGMDATLSIDSSAEHGTSVVLQIPLEKTEEKTA